jgi:hypothetical protein
MMNAGRHDGPPTLLGALCCVSSLDPLANTLTPASPSEARNGDCSTVPSDELTL